MLGRQFCAFHASIAAPVWTGTVVLPMPYDRHFPTCNDPLNACDGERILLTTREDAIMLRRTKEHRWEGMNLNQESATMQEAGATDGKRQTRPM